MKKPRSDSHIDRLTPEQQAEVKRWVFEENLSYSAASARLLETFGIRLGRSAFGRYYQRKNWLLTVPVKARVKYTV